jgi:DNA-binding HxlR family transcriptional regulator
MGAAAVRGLAWQASDLLVGAVGVISRTRLRIEAAVGGPIEFCDGLRAAVELLAKRWTLVIVELLLQRAARFCELSRALPRISERVLSQRLWELVESGLATREVDPARRLPRPMRSPATAGRSSR